MPTLSNTSLSEGMRITSCNYHGASTYHACDQPCRVSPGKQTSWLSPAVCVCVQTIFAGHRLARFWVSLDSDPPRELRRISPALSRNLGFLYQCSLCELPPAALPSLARGGIAGVPVTVWFCDREERRREIPPEIIFWGLHRFGGFYITLAIHACFILLFSKISARTICIIQQQ